VPPAHSAAVASGRRHVPAPAVIAAFMAVLVVTAVAIVLTRGAGSRRAAAHVAAARPSVSAPPAGSQLWSVPIGDISAPVTPAVAGNVAYLTDNAGKVFALDLNTRNHLWETQLAGVETSLESPVVDGDVVVASGGVWADSRPTSAVLAALNRLTGEVLWTKTVPDDDFRQKAIHGGQLFVGSYDSRLFAFDLSTGNELWQGYAGSSITSAPAVDDQTVYVGSDANELLAFDRTTGQQQWKVLLTEWVRSPILLGNAGVYARDDGGVIVCVDSRSGAERWRLSSKSSGADGSALALSGDGTMLFTADTMDEGRPALTAVGALDGQVRWRFATGDSASRAELFSPPAVYGDTVYAATFSGAVYALDSRTGTQTWRGSLGAQGASTPVKVGGTLLVSAYDNRLHALAVAP
jgi:eukaryotic-like serine/threonine-protein kinase